MSTLADLPVGAIGFGPIGGVAGAGIRLGELLVAPFDHWPSWRDWRKVAHCGTVTQAATPGFAARTYPGGNVSVQGIGPMFAQAEPGGFQEIELGAEHWTSDWVYLLPNYAPGQADLVAQISRRMARKKIQYGFEDYAAIAAHRAGLHTAGVDDFISRVDADGDPCRAICSQAVDAQLTLSGGLVKDPKTGKGGVFMGILPQDVTPSELYLRLRAIGCAMVFRPDAS